MKRLIFVAVVVALLGLVENGHAGSITLDIDGTRSEHFLEDGRLITHRTGSLLYEGAQIGTATLLSYQVFPTSAQPAPDNRYVYAVIEAEVGEFSGLIATTAVPIESIGDGELPAALIDQGTGTKLLSGTLSWFSGGPAIGVRFTFTWRD